MSAEPARLDMDAGLRFGDLALSWRLHTRAASVAIVGPSGAGKSTALRVLAGLEKRATGQILVDGEPWLDSDAGVFRPPWQRRVGWVPQDALLFPHRSVRQNLAWSGPSDEALQRVAELLEIGALLDRRPRKLSGGERQRVALGRALLSRPRLLLLDEPFAALDRRLRLRLSEVVAERCREQGVMLVLVSHDDGDVERLAEQVHVMEGGSLRPLQGSVEG